MELLGTLGSLGAHPSVGVLSRPGDALESIVGAGPRHARTGMKCGDRTCPYRSVMPV